MYLITGAAGFIGYHKSLNLLKKNKYVVGIDNFSNYYDPKLKNNRIKELKKFRNFKFIKMDLAKKNEFNKLKNLKKNINFIYHFAGQAGVRYSFKNPASYIKNNILGHVHLLEFFKKEKINTIFYASSSSVYGETIGKKRIPESIYAVSKKTLEDISRVYSINYNLKIVGLRFFTVYGPYGRPDMSVYKFFKLNKENKHIEIYNNGQHKRSFSFIDDVIKNLHKMENAIRKYPKPYCNTFNLGNPASIELTRLVDLIEKILNSKLKIKYLKKQPGDVTATKANIDREKKLFNIFFKTSLENGLRKFHKWFLTYEK